MKTRYSSLVSVKKNSMNKSEMALGKAKSNLENALYTLEQSYQSLSEIVTPSSGTMPAFLSSRMLLDRQRELIKHDEELVLQAQHEIFEAKERLKIDTLEYEKFNYLELQEIELELKRLKVLENKDLDEIALMTYETNKYRRKSS